MTKQSSTLKTLCLCAAGFLNLLTSNADQFTNNSGTDITADANWSSGNVPVFGGPVTTRLDINGTTEYSAAQGNTTVNQTIGLIISLNNGNSGNLTIGGGNLTINNTPRGSVGVGLGTFNNANGDADWYLNSRWRQFNHCQRYRNRIQGDSSQWSRDYQRRIDPHF